MNKKYIVCWILFALLCACSNSEFYATEDFSTEANSFVHDSLVNASIEEKSSTIGATTDSTHVKKDSVNAKKDSTNVNNDSVNVKKDSANINNDSVNTKKDSANINNDSINARKDSANINNDSVNARKDSANAKDSLNKIIAQAASRALIPDAGFKKPFTLSPPSTQGILQCTFDGSEPDSTTPAFSEARLIDTTTVVRCYEFIGGTLAKQQTETYFINEKINMPVVSISVDPYYVAEYLDASPCQPNPCKGAKFWEDIEYPAHVEYFANGSSSKEKAFEINAGISIAGNYSRNYEKKSVEIRMRKEYQSGRLHYPLFESRPEKSSFKGFKLRNNGNRFERDLYGEALATSLLEGTNVDYQRSRQVVVFYNGDYRGIYGMQEKLNKHFIETNYGIDNNNVDFIKIINDDLYLKNGSLDDYLNTIQFIDKSNFKDDSAAYRSVSKMIDIPNYMEYMAAEIFYYNEDWPQNNVRVWKSGNSPWKFIAYDIDHGLDYYPKLAGFTENTNMIDWILSGGRPNLPCYGGNNYKCFGNIFIKLIQNSDFKQSFINRASYLYSTFINGEKVAQQIDRINKSIDPAQITRDLAMYNRVYRKNACGTFFETNGSCLKTWSYNRDKTVRKDFKEAFDLSDEVPIIIEIKGNGILKLDDFDIKQSQEYKWNVFEHHPMKLSVECPNGSKFIKWEDDSTDPNRVIDPVRNSIYVAECQ